MQKPLYNVEEFERKCEELESVICRAHFNQAVKRLQAAFEAALDDNPKAARYLIEKVHLIAGSRRGQARADSVEARRRR